MKLVKLKNKFGEVYNEQRLENNQVNDFLSREFTPYEVSEQLTVEISDALSDDEIKLAKKAQRNAIRAIKNASNVAQLKVALIELIKYLDIGEENE